MGDRPDPEFQAKGVITFSVTRERIMRRVFAQVSGKQGEMSIECAMITAERFH